MHKDTKKTCTEVTEFQALSIQGWDYDRKAIAAYEPKTKEQQIQLNKFLKLSNGKLPDVHRTNGRRVTSPLVCMRGAARKHITYKGEQLVEIDTANSQPLILVTYLINNGFDVENELRVAVASGTFYDYFNR